nr:integrase, catalytic region, zinc finger, CCHC-type, peptidase aspartic, catalytic [Tanacetum cinerariifolium]
MRIPLLYQEKKTRKIDRLEISLLIQGLSNDTYSLIDSNDTAKDLEDALERQMCGSEYGEQDRKAAILYEDTRSAHNCNNARNAYCNSYDDDVNDLFVFDDISLRKSHVSKMHFRKKPSTSLNMPSRSKLNISLPRIVRCSKHMMGNRALLTNFVEKFLGTVRFGNNDFVLIAGYGNVVIGSMTIKKVYYIEEKIIVDLEDEVVSLLEKEKTNLETIESLKSKGFESSENVVSESKNQSENDYQVVEKECDNVESSKVIVPGMFKLNVSQSISPTSVLKTFCAAKNVENKTKRKRRKRKSSKQNDKQKWSSNTSNVDLSSISNSKLNKDVKRYSRKDLLSCNNSHLGETSRAFVCNDVMNVSCNSRLDDLFDVNYLFIFDDESKKKGSSNTSNVGLSAVSVSNLNKNVKRYSHKDLLACNNSHLGETRSDFVCNDAMNVSCDFRMNDLLDDNNFFIFDDVNIRISPVSKMPFRKKLRDSMHTVQIFLWIIDLGCSKHMMGNRALLTNFVEKFLGT